MVYKIDMYATCRMYRIENILYYMWVRCMTLDGDFKYDLDYAMYRIMCEHRIMNEYTLYKVQYI